MVGYGFCCSGDVIVYGLSFIFVALSTQRDLGSFLIYCLCTLGLMAFVLSLLCDLVWKWRSYRIGLCCDFYNCSVCLKSGGPKYYVVSYVLGEARDGAYANG